MPQVILLPPSIRPTPFETPSGTRYRGALGRIVETAPALGARGQVVREGNKEFVRFFFPQRTGPRTPGFTRAQVGALGREFARILKICVGRMYPPASDPYDFPASRWMQHQIRIEAAVGRQAKKEAKEADEPHLVDSIGYQITSVGRSWRLDVGTVKFGASHFPYLEGGTSAMRPRPFASRALAEFFGEEFDVAAAEQTYLAGRGSTANLAPRARGTPPGVVIP